MHTSSVEDALTPSVMVIRGSLGEGYGNNLTDVDFGKIGRDPLSRFLCLAEDTDEARTVVSNLPEASKPN